MRSPRHSLSDKRVWQTGEVQCIATKNREDRITGVSLGGLIVKTTYPIRVRVRVRVRLDSEDHLSQQGYGVTVTRMFRVRFGAR